MSAPLSPHFVLALAEPCSDAGVSRLVAALRDQCRRYLDPATEILDPAAGVAASTDGEAAAPAPEAGAAARIVVAGLDPGVHGGPPPLAEVIDAAAARGAGAVFIVPVSLGLPLPAQEHLAAAARDGRRRYPELAIHYCAPDPTDPALISAFVARASAALLGSTGQAGPGGPAPALGPASPPVPPPSLDRLGVLLVAAGDSDAPTRAHAYQAMRLIWEHLGVARGEVAFLRHARRAMPEVLDDCLKTGLRWIILPYYLWHATHLGYLQVIRDDFVARRPQARDWPLAAPLGDDPAVTRWLWQQMHALWDDHLRARRGRRLSARRRPLVAPSRSYRPAGSDRGGVIVDLADPDDLSDILSAHGVDRAPVLVKVTWHGYAPGTYTDPTALATLLQALPGPAHVIEGHTASRNRGGADWDWERDGRAHRAWIQEEDRVYRERTGLQRVLDAHGARYVNVTEAWWDDDCAPADEVAAALAAEGVELHHPELLGYVPRALFEHRGAPFISFARFKGPTRLGLANLFGLLPVPLRTAWHGPNITYMARVCCDLARLYGTLFTSYGLVESLDVAVRWDRRGAYRSRWGNYDLIHRPGVITLSPGLAVADVLASRLQGQDVRRSAFFDVVKSELGFPDECATAALDPELRARFG
ncbi:CbiX/SirB N-terminal domain-containing protein [Haliangium sp.]|uniref:CbiX/SirB N-terminal domain-containing protein n=1 Tax=Haliangium sp. TaxID=2663208 RepID=UPI003D11A99C